MIISKFGNYFLTSIFRSKLEATPDLVGAVEKMCVDDGMFADWTIISDDGQNYKHKQY